MSTPAFKPSEGKREEFRKYLEKNGIMDALTKVLVSLYEEVEKPEDALAYIRDKLAVQAGLETYGVMKSAQEELQTKINELNDEIEALKLAAEGAAPEEAPPEGEGEELPPAEGDAPPDAPPAEEGEAPPAAEPAPENVE